MSPQRSLFRNVSIDVIPACFWPDPLAGTIDARLSRRVGTGMTIKTIPVLLDAKLKVEVLRLDEVTQK